MADFFGMDECTQHFMSLWRSYKRPIARVHARPSPAARHRPVLRLVIMAGGSRDRLPAGARLGCPTTAMWVYASAPNAPSACCSPATS